MDAVKKMKQGMSYTRKEKTIILNVYKYFRSQFPDKCITDIVRRTSKATGCSEKSIFQFRKEETSPEGFKEPSKVRVRKNININSRFIKYDDNVRQGIKSIIYDLKSKNILPSLQKILKTVNSDDTLPNFSLMTLRRLLLDMGFYYEKNDSKKILTERQDVKLESDDNCDVIKNKTAKQKINNVPKSPENIVPKQNDINTQHAQNKTLHSNNFTPSEPQTQTNVPQINNSSNNMYIPSNRHFRLSHYGMLPLQPQSLLSNMPRPPVHHNSHVFDPHYHHQVGHVMGHHTLHSMAAPSMEEIGGIIHQSMMQS